MHSYKPLSWSFMHRLRDRKGRHIKTRNIIETKPPSLLLIHVLRQGSQPAKEIQEGLGVWRMSLEALSQILAMARISTSQEAYILTSFRSWSTSPQPQENYEVSFEETKESCTKSDGEHPVKPDMEEFSSCLSMNFACIRETNCPSFPRMTEEDLEISPNEEGS